MASALESKTPHFGLRDFLFYLVPGVPIFLAIIIHLAIDVTSITKFGGLASSIIAILAAYILGQISYGFTYPLRKILRYGFSESEKGDNFQEHYMWAVENHTAYYTAEIFRYRNFARFCLAMISPCLFLGGSLLLRFWDHGAWRYIIFFSMIFSVWAFIHRYFRYSKEYIRMVQLCWDFDWKKHAENGRCANEDSS